MRFADSWGNTGLWWTRHPQVRIVAHFQDELPFQERRPSAIREEVHSCPFPHPQKAADRHHRGQTRFHRWRIA